MKGSVKTYQITEGDLNSIPINLTTSFGPTNMSDGQAPINIPFTAILSPFRLMLFMDIRTPPLSFVTEIVFLFSLLTIFISPFDLPNNKIIQLKNRLAIVRLMFLSLFPLRQIYPYNFFIYIAIFGDEHFMTVLIFPCAFFFLMDAVMYSDLKERA
jgi:hypothetical protein